MTEFERQPITQHFAELRKRLMIALSAYLLAVICSYYFAPALYEWLVQPLAAQLEGEPRRLIYTGLTEAFFTYLKLAMFAGLLLAFPVIAAQLYAFLAPGLYAHEKRAFVPYLVAAPVLFLAGASFCYFFIMPVAWKFFLSFETPGATGGLPIILEARVSEYLGLVMHLVLAFGLSFQLPVVLALLAHRGVVNTSTLKRGRRFAVVIIAAISAVITPPDAFSMIALALPLYLLYEASIILCQLIETKRLAHA